MVGKEGANGGRGGGIDLTFGAPKSVSILWALGDLSNGRSSSGRMPQRWLRRSPI